MNEEISLLFYVSELPLFDSVIVEIVRAIECKEKSVKIYKRRKAKKEG